MSLTLLSHKWLAVALVFLTTFSLSLLTLRGTRSWPQQLWARYVAYLDRTMRLLFVPERGRVIATVQLATAATLLAALSFVDALYGLFALGAVAFGPSFYFRRAREQRLRQIEAKVDGFLTTLANALKSTPSIGGALAYTHTLLPTPIDVEVGLALKEVRMGSTVDQALSNMGSRIRSTPLNAALTGILIGRQIGGDLPRILETTAVTLREMNRLQGLVRSKTAEGKAQVLVLAAFPAVILVLFDTASKGYFEPLLSSYLGWIVILASATLWLTSLVIARKILQVDL